MANMNFGDAFSIARSAAIAEIERSKQAEIRASAYTRVLHFLESITEPEKHLESLNARIVEMKPQIEELEKAKEKRAHELAVLEHQITEANQKIVDLQKDCEAAEKIIQKGATAARILAKIHQGENAIGLTRELTILLSS